VMNEKLKKMWDKNSEWIQRDLHFINDAIEESKKENPEILKWINARFEKGKIYWIVWRNWAGKTTLINLLMWYFDEYQWDIMYGNSDIKKIENSFFEWCISYVSQSPYLMENFTVKENLILWVEREITDTELFSYLKKFWLEKTVKSLRKWLDAEIWFDTEFSWWQRQLLALIRAILQDKKIIIFDEWTNQLDAENELLVMNELLKNKKDKLIIFITHRMTTIKKADMIYCIEDWMISDSWNHDALLSKDSLYKGFWENQVERGFGD
jgi:ABC-type multidrug transport system fused ATPase/permease subunit